MMRPSMFGCLSCGLSKFIVNEKWAAGIYPAARFSR
jgi:hypothetical protein